MHVCMCVAECVHVCGLVYGGQGDWVFSSVALLSFCDGVLHNLVLTGLVRLVGPASPRSWCVCHHLPSSPRSSLGAGALESGHHVWVTDTLPTESSPQPHSLLIYTCAQKCLYKAVY